MGEFTKIVMAGGVLIAVAAASAATGIAAEWGGANNNIPPGLIISGEKGRVDNGVGNGGENIDPGGRTPDRYGENGPGDDDPGGSKGHAKSDKNDGKPHSPASAGIDGVDAGN